MIIRGSRIGAIASFILISLSSGIWLNRAIAQVGSDQPVKNPGVSGISSPTPSGNGGATIDQPVTNPGVSGGNYPTPTLSQPNPTFDGSQPVTNPGTSGINTPSLTQPSQPANPDTIRTIVLPSDIPSAIVQPRTNRTPPTRTPQVTQPVTPQATPTQIDNGRATTGFIKTAVPTQLANNPNTQRLDAQLLQATCSQNWQGAIAIVDRALESAPNQTYRSQLRTYRNRLASLSSARTTIPNWSQKCTGG